MLLSNAKVVPFDSAEEAAESLIIYYSWEEFEDLETHEKAAIMCAREILNRKRKD